MNDTRESMNANTPTIGIANLGNTCGINTWLQCIFASPGMCNILMTSVFQEDSFGKCLQTLVNAWKHNTDTKIIVPQNLIKMIYKMSKGLFAPGEQLDVCELWEWSLQQLHEELATPWSIPSQYHPPHADQQVARKVITDLLKFQNGKHSHLLNLTQGVTLSFVKCNICNYVVYNTEPFVTLPLDVPNTNNQLVLSELFINYFKKEDMSEWTCDRCKKKEASRMSRFWSIPNTLLVVLKRFQMMSNGQFRKNSKEVDIPEQITFHQGSVISAANTFTYNLKNMALHHGSYYNGHYTAVVCHKDKWLHCDDDTIMGVNILDVIKNNRNAYVLIYERCDLS